MLVRLYIEDYPVEVDLVYATSNNFTGKPVYKKGFTEVYLHTKALKLFIVAIKQASVLGLRFKVWDAFRPLEAQQKLWNHTPSKNYISHPRTGERPHCRGGAIDLTLIDVNGKSLDMGTVFDDFSTQAHQGCLTISSDAQRNRMLLAGIMHSSGFLCHPFEWWHFQLPNLKNYPVLSNKDAPVSMIE